ncbi:uncharacterized protein BT62DRAFT_1081765 [Guyanagaster necrorhizus]|uniref:Uncharacterized protein n=1 Tax=Guyanagaster necrorhizus TaxID=856835 RepID=A0A9P7VDZ9_9AGAR|nr:uncharacterized protein BT62DRAFT_1081765 [Guyanagaster necrorhizus MCA 3950]KAG7439153.1 hypothetical protein BT62DRAFT_1081765 [Guyanagaster necrorhizus MCA 3950]
MLEEGTRSVHVYFGDFTTAASLTDTQLDLYLSLLEERTKRFSHSSVVDAQLQTLIHPFVTQPLYSRAKSDNDQCDLDNHMSILAPISLPEDLPLLIFKFASDGIGDRLSFVSQAPTFLALFKNVPHLHTFISRYVRVDLSMFKDAGEEPPQFFSSAPPLLVGEFCGWDFKRLSTSLHRFTDL